MNLNFKEKKMMNSLFQGQFGIEKESLRTNLEGFLSHTKHPFPNNSNIERDFCENQTEMITDVCSSVEEAHGQLLRIHRNAKEKLWNLETGKEIFWPFSNPPYVRGEKDIKIASYHGKLKGKEIYREYLAKKYGKKKMLFSGIHFNYSLSEEWLEESYVPKAGCTYREYRDQCYLGLAAKLTKYSWLPVYLTAASPLIDGSFEAEKDLGKTVSSGYASMRCSEIGYWNPFVPLLDYHSLDSYVDSIQSYVDSGQLKSAAELYYPVRLKSAGENSLETLAKSGINHLEFRMLDLNPYEECGVSLEDLKFLHYLMIYLLFQDTGDFVYSEQETALKNIKNAAKFEESRIWIGTGWNKKVPIREAASNVLESMERFFSHFENEDIRRNIQSQKRKILSGERYAVRVKQDFDGDFVKKGLEYVKKGQMGGRKECAKFSGCVLWNDRKSIAI